MKKIIILLQLMILFVSARAKDYPFGKGVLRITPMAWNAVRVQYMETATASTASPIPDVTQWIYVATPETEAEGLTVSVDSERQILSVSDKAGTTVFTATAHELRQQVSDDAAYSESTLRLASPADEYLYGLGQFQDGYVNLRGLSRRLTQVNTQISIPLLLSSKGYGLLWNNGGLVEYNPGEQHITLLPSEMAEVGDTVNVTSTEGGKQEVRRQHRFESTVSIESTGDYSVLLDVGQKMARRHFLCIDGKAVIDMRNVWLPPTASAIVHLDKGEHRLTAELSDGDQPTVSFRKVTDETVFRSPVALSVDYTVMVGTPDEIIATYRHLTGEAPLMPRWALGYIHCRERFHSQDEILQTAQRFRSEHLPIDMIVQDWQYWGKYGWNSMQFDEAYYPSPRLLTDSLHAMHLRLMVSVWSKIDKSSAVGRQMESEGHYIPGTDWIDFFNPSSAQAYWRHFSQRLLPLGIDAWWQDATEPENDDLVGRLVNGGKWHGEWVRNIYPLLVNKTVYEGLLSDRPIQRPMILTRCGFPGIQRYGSALWSGDVGNDWDTFRRQLSAGLSMQAAGIPWWTYDAGGFFRPSDQYTDADYIERMLRWIETSVYLPLMRVHGYMSNTEPWQYGSEAQKIIADCLHERYRLLPYIYSHAAAIWAEGSTLMRPLVFDFSHDIEALQQTHEYMFGRALLVCPITQPHVTQSTCYLPQHHAGWFNYHTSAWMAGGREVRVDVTPSSIPVFVKGGSIVPIGLDKEYTSAGADAPLEIRIYPGDDATFTLYEDDGKSQDYLHGAFSTITFTWHEASHSLTLSKRTGSYDGMPKKRVFKISVVGKGERQAVYKGKEINMKL